MIDAAAGVVCGIARDRAALDVEGAMVIDAAAVRVDSLVARYGAAVHVEGALFVIDTTAVVDCGIFRDRAVAREGDFTVGAVIDAAAGVACDIVRDERVHL